MNEHRIHIYHRAQGLILFVDFWDFCIMLRADIHGRAVWTEPW
jgi:hypothetical protein